MSDSSATRPKRGDHIRVYRMGGLYYHHGIFISDDEVIHLSRENGASLSQAYVMQTDLKTFLEGGTVEVVKHDAEELYPVEDIVEYTRDCVGEKGYNLFFDNCEHFANECAIGERRSDQVKRAGTTANFIFDVIGGRTMGLLSSIVTGALGWIGGKLFGSSGKRPPAKTEKVKLAEIESKRQSQLAEIERDKQMRLAEIESNTRLTLAEKETARAEIDRDRQLKLAALENERIQRENAARIEFLQEQTRARMAEASQRARFAELENELQLKLIDKDEERIQLMRDAQVDIIKAQTMSQILIERARFEGMTTLAEKLMTLQEKINELASKRFLIISSARMSVVQDVEKYYGEIVAEIEERRITYPKEKLPLLLEMLVQYEEGTPQYKVYEQQISKDQDMEEEVILKLLDAALNRQQTVVEATMASEQKIIEQTGEFALILAKASADLKQLPSAKN